MKNLLALLFVFNLVCAHAQTCIPNSSSLQLDGAGAYVDLGPATSIDTLSGPVTVEAWIYPTAWGFNSAQNTIFCTHGWTVGEQGFVLRVGGTGELSFNIAGRDTQSVPVSWVEVESPLNSLQLNTWTHVAGTFSGTELKVFINGIEVAMTPFTGTIVHSTYGAKIGRLADINQNPGRFFSGNIDEVRVWNKALSATELWDSAAVQIEPASNTGLISYWQLNDGAGTMATDLGSGANDGTLLSASWSTGVPFGAIPPTPFIAYNSGSFTSSAASNNQWNLGGVPIVGATGQFYVPTVNGSYTVTVTNSNGCSATSAAIVLTTVGIDSPVSDGQLSLWPNPCSQQLHISSDHFLQGSVELFIYDAQGRVVLHKSVAGHSTDVLQIRTDRFGPGIYSLSLVSHEVLQNMRFIVE